MITFFFYIFLGIVGAAFGSFLNVLILRTRSSESVFFGRSHCNSCKKVLSAKELIPIVSYIWLRGKSHCCKISFSRQYLLIEVWVAFCAMALFFYHQELNLLYFRDAIILYFLTFTFVYDFLFQEIWSRMTLLPAVLILPIQYVLYPDRMMSFVYAMLIGTCFFLFQYVASRGTWVGGGDVRLGLFMGVILGFPLILVALFLAYIVGALLSVILIALKKKTLASKTPFGTYLAIATVVTLFWGSEMLGWYLSFF